MPTDTSVPPENPAIAKQVLALSFASRIALWFGAMFVAGIVIVVRLWYVGLPLADLPGAYQQRLDAATELLQLGADRHIAQIASILREKRGDVLVIAENRVLASALGKRDPLLEKDFKRVYERLQRAYPDTYHALLLVNASTQDILATHADDAMLPASEAMRGLIQRAVQPGVTELVEQIETPHGSFLAITRQMTLPDVDGMPQGAPVGVLVALLNLPPFLGGSNDLGNAGIATSLLDSAGLILASKPLADERFVPDVQVAPGFEGALQQTLSNQTRVVALYRYYQLNSTQGWTLVHYTSIEQATLGLSRLLAGILMVGSLLVLLGIAVILYGARRVTAPLRRLASVATKFGSGQFGARAAIDQFESREVVQLATAFNAMAGHLEHSQQRLEAEVTQRTAEAVAARDQLLATLDALPDLLFEVDRHGRIYSYHSNSHDLLASPPERFINQTFADTLPADAAQACLQAIALAAENGSSTGTHYCLPLAHGVRWFEASVSTKQVTSLQSLEPIESTESIEPSRFILLARDITDRKVAEDEVRRLAFFDPLTGLANRRLMIDRLDQARTASARSGHHNGLLLIDLDHFKNLNDTLGHEVGDQLLIEAGHRFTVCVREGDTVSRLGGDEFVIVLRDFSSDAEIAALEIERIAEKVRKELARPYTLRTSEAETRMYHITLSIGICPFKDSSETAEELLKRADTAMYQAKHAGRNAFRFFDPSMQIAVQARANLEEQLREAVAREEFVLHYQPLIAADGRCIGAEALVRWQHPTRGLLSPAAFITQMELSGLILPLGHWVLRQACATLSAWQNHPEFGALTLAVNVSARQMHLPNFVGEALAVIGSAGITPQQLKMELTESLLLEDTEDIISKMIALKAAGVRFALDDFGTGYSSLSYLKRLPLDQLKIDRSFVRDILTDPNDIEIARLVLGLAHTLSLSVLAEGVETIEQHELLLTLGCHAFQGYLFAKPMPLAEFEDWFAKRPVC